MDAELVYCIDDLVSCHKEILRRLYDLTESVETHAAWVNRSQTAGLEICLDGLIAAPITMGVSMFGGATTGNYFRSREFGEAVGEIARLNQGPQEVFANILKQMCQQVAPANMFAGRRVRRNGVIFPGDSTIAKVLGNSIHVKNILDEVNTIRGWTRNHPNLRQIIDSIRRQEDLIARLLSMKEDIQTI